MAHRPASHAAEDRWTALRRASAAFAAPGLGVDVAIRCVAESVAELLGDACVVRVLDAEGAQLVPVALVHRDPARLPVFERIFVAGPVPAREGIHARVISGRRPVIVEVADPAFASTQPAQAEILREAGVARFILAPMRTPQEVVGTVGFSREDAAWIFTTEDGDLLQEIADRAALTIRNARLIEEERKARTRAELSAWALREKVAELEAAEMRFHAAVDAASSGMLILSPEWTILEANRAFREHVGFRGPELQGSPLTALVHPADEPNLREQARSLAASGERVEMQLRLVGRSREAQWVTLSAALARDAAGSPGVVIAHVIPHASVPAAPESRARAGEAELTAIGRALSNPVNVTLLARLADGPAHPRALAHALERSEGDIQRKLRALEKAGLVAGAWRHREGATVREYHLTGRTVELSLGKGREDH